MPAASVAGPTFAELWDNHFTPWAERHQKVTWENSKRWHGAHLKEHFGAMPWNTITHADIDRYCDKRLKAKGQHTQKPIEASTVNLEVGTARRCLNYCLKGPTRVISGSNPFERYPALKTVANRRFHISEEQFVQLLEHSRPLLRLMLVFSFETGMRRDEFRCLEWSEVDMEQAKVDLPAERTKTRRARTIPLSDVALSVLRTVPRFPRSVYVFESPKGNKAVPETTLHNWFEKARKAAGIRGPKGQPIWIHTLRKSFGTIQAMAGMPIYQLMEVMGHTDPNVHYEYTRMSPDYYDSVRARMNHRIGPQPAAATKAPKEPVERTGSPLLAFVRSE